MLNSVIIMGRLTADPELRTTTNGLSVTSFTVAVDRNYKSGDERQTDFISVVAWRERAEFVAKYFKKGRPLLVCGQLQNRSWTDAQGNKRYVTEVVADEITFVENKNSAGVGEGGSYAPDAYGAASASVGNAPEFEEVDDNSLPF
jgi:single-strand DNA-binding protein